MSQVRMIARIAHEAAAQIHSGAPDISFVSHVTACTARLATITFFVLFALIALANTAFSRAAESPADDPYVAAAREAGVPLEVLVAVAGAESGYHPYALNIGGKQVYCHSRDEAERFLATEDNVDIGLMQIDWPFWGPRLGVSKTALLDARTNLRFGARILKQ
ncbi:MAG TPA: transglycosylase SLT domain-containing protein, partial [Candidatus Binataceae bacterium]